MGGDGKFWAVGGEPAKKEANSAAGKEKPADVNKTQQLLPSETIQKPVAAALPKAETAVPQPAAEPAKAQPAPAAKEKTLDELKEDRMRRREAIGMATSEASEKLDKLQSYSDELKKKCEDIVKTFEIRRAGEASTLDSKRDSDINTINSAKAEHATDAEAQREESKKEAMKTHEGLMLKIGSERDAAVKEIEGWYAARAFELDPKNHPSAWLSGAVKDPRLSSALRTGAADPSGEEFVALEFGAIQKKRTERLKAIEEDFDSKKTLIDESRVSKEEAADGKHAAVVKEADETAVKEMKSAGDAHAAGIMKLDNETTDAISTARKKTNETLIAVAKNMDAVKTEFAEKVNGLKDVNKPVPAELLKRPEPVKAEFVSGVQKDAVPISRNELAKAEPAAEPSAAVKRADAAPMGRYFKTAFWTVLVAGAAAAMPFIKGWEPSPKLASVVQGYAFPVDQRPITIDAIKRNADKLAKIHKAKRAQVLMPEPVKPKTHVITPQEKRQLLERIAALKAAREARNADAKLSKALNGFERRIATMKNEKGGFLYLGKGAVSYAQEVAVMLEKGGKSLSVKQKDRISEMLSKNDMSRKRLKPLHAHISVLVAMQAEINKVSATGKRAEVQKKGIHDAVAKIKAAAKIEIKPAAKPVAPTSAVAPKLTGKGSTESAVKAIQAIGAAGLSVKAPEKKPEKKADEKGPKKETIMTPASASVQASTGPAIAASALSSNYSASGGMKPPWMDWTAGADNSRDYVSLPGAQANFTAFPAAGAMSTTLASAKREDVTKAPEKLVEAARPADKVEQKKEEKTEPKKGEKKTEPESVQDELMIVGNTIYTYPGQRLEAQMGKNINGFLSKKSAEAAYKAAKEAAEEAVTASAKNDEPEDIHEVAERLGLSKFHVDRKGN